MAKFPAGFRTSCTECVSYKAQFDISIQHVVLDEGKQHCRTTLISAANFLPVSGTAASKSEAFLSGHRDPPSNVKKKKVTCKKLRNVEGGWRSLVGSHAVGLGAVSRRAGGPRSRVTGSVFKGVICCFEHIPVEGGGGRSGRLTFTNRSPYG